MVNLIMNKKKLEEKNSKFKISQFTDSVIPLLLIIKIILVFTEFNVNDKCFTLK